LCEAVKNPNAATNSAPKDVRDQEIDTPSLHLAPLTHSYSTQGDNQDYEHRDENHQDCQQNPRIPLQKIQVCLYHLEIDVSFEIIGYPEKGISKCLNSKNLK
jgi:hypothetical protein